MLKIALKVLLGFLFPIKCLQCKKNGEYLCKSCIDAFPITDKIIFSTPSPAFSKNKHRPVPEPYASGTGLCGIIAPLSYPKSPILQKAIHIFKYSSIKQLAYPLASIMRKRITSFCSLNQKEWLVVPVPLHKRKVLERGFNQNDLLAEAVFLEDVPGNFEILSYNRNPLKRIKYTTSQTSLSGIKRINNVRGVFSVQNKEIIKDRDIILIDDVTTTGSTLNEAARVLINSGARQVWGAVLAAAV